MTLTKAQKEAMEQFVAVAETNNFDMITTVEQVPTCGVWLKDGTDIPCLAVAHDEGIGAWTICDMEGRVRQYLANEIW
jgi:hypothetical protein